MKNPLFIILLFAAGCVLPETRTTVVKQHIFSQEDTSFYFSDCEIKSRADSFELARLTKEMKFYNAPNLSYTTRNEIRLFYSRAFHEPYLIRLLNDGKVIVSTLDTSDYNQYETEWDTLHLSAKEKLISKAGYSRSYYLRKGCLDSAKAVEQQYPGMVDSLYALHIRLTMYKTIRDTVSIVNTTLYTDRNLFTTIASKLNDIGFWKMDVYENSGATDGSGWTLEAKVGDKHYSVTKVNDLSRERPLEEVCKMLLKFANIPPRKVY